MADAALRETVADGATHLCALAALALTARAVRVGRGWRIVPPCDPAPPLPALSVIVPARNEEATIERCVRSLLAQTIAVELIVVDDRSTDRTAEVLAALAAEEPRLRIVRGDPLPGGWVGKPWALAQGARIARGTWLLFTDADTWHAPHACASTLAYAVGHDVDALTVGTLQELGSWGERSALPTILGMVLIASGSMEQLNDPYDPDHALANGQYLLVSRAAYDALGGHTALRGELVDDVAFARRLKRDGRFRMLIAGGESLVRVRMYRSLGDVWAGFTKNMYAGAGGDLGALLGAAAFLGLLSVVPASLAVDAAVRRRPLRACEALLCLANGIAVQAYGYAKTALPRRLAFWAPVGYAICGAVVLNSTLRVRIGRGVSWRGRRYAGHPAYNAR